MRELFPAGKYLFALISFDEGRDYEILTVYGTKAADPEIFHSLHFFYYFMCSTLLILFSGGRSSLHGFEPKTVSVYGRCPPLRERE